MCIVCNAGLAGFLKASFSRRDFLKYAGATAASSGLMASGILATPGVLNQPRRTQPRSGV